MASSKVMASTSPPNPDLPRQSPSSSSLHHHHRHHSYGLSSSSSQLHHHQQQQQLGLLTSDDHSRGSFGSMNMEEILRNIYSESDGFPAAPAAPVAEDGGGVSSVDLSEEKVKTADEVWSEMVTGGGGVGGGTNREPQMTLEDFLTKAGAVAEEDIRVQVVPPPDAAAGYGADTMMNPVQYQPGLHMQNGPPGGFGIEAAPLGFGNGMVVVGVGTGGASSGGGGRGKRRMAEDAPVDKATQQKQRRMIKNRESAARSRERKQAYTVELESLVTQLEEENARLLREEAEMNKQRYKQLMENLIPVVEKRRPPRVLRRVHSMSW